MLSKNDSFLFNFKYFTIFVLILCFITQIQTLSFKYPTAFTLNDGKIFVIHSLGIDICNPQYTRSTRILTFSSEIEESNLSKISISKYSNGEFIIFIINKIYLFDENGNYKNSTNAFNSIYGEYYTLTAHKITKSNDVDYYYFLFGYIDISDETNFICRLYYYYISNLSDVISTVASRSFKDSIIYNGLSCEFLLYNNKEYILCVYERQKADNTKTSAFSIFYIENGSFNFIEEHLFHISIIEYIKSTTKLMESKPFFCGLNIGGESICLIFDIYEFLKDAQAAYFDNENEKKCLKEPYNIKTYYFQETGEYVFSCLTVDNTIQTTIYAKNMTKMSDIGNPSMRLQKNFSEYDKFYYSIIYSQVYKTYVVLSDIDNDLYHHFILIEEEDKNEILETIENNLEEEKLEEYYYKQEKTAEENDEKPKGEEEFKSEFKEEEEKLEEKEKSKEEEKLEEEEKSKEEEKIEENEVISSVSDISKNYIYCIKYNNFNEILKGCDFMNNELEYYNNCSNDQYYINICEKNEKYYYPKVEDLIDDNTYINCCCIPEGYYLYMNNSNLVTKPCYSSCKICEKEGNNKYHKCIECKDNFKFGLNVSNYFNCYMSKVIYNFNNKSEIENIKEILLNSFESLQSLNGEAIEFEIENIIISLTNTHNQRNNVNKNKTTIDLGECENKLKQINKIPIDDSLYILKYDIKEEGMNIPKIEYEVYYPFSSNIITKLDLTVCKDMKIDVSLPISITDDLEKYNTSSDYYNDLCSKATSKVGTDITLRIDKKNS